MLTTTLDLTVIPARTFNGVKNAVVATLSDGREVWLGESDSRGIKRAKLEVFNVDPTTGSGAALERTLRRLERDEARIKAEQEAIMVK